MRSFLNDVYTELWAVREPWDGSLFGINPKTCGILKILLKTFKLSQSQKHHSIEFKNLINSYLMDIHLKKI